MRSTVLPLLLLWMIPSLGLTQKIFSIGGYGAYGKNYYMPNFPVFAGGSGCAIFSTGGGGYGFNGGLAIDIPVTSTITFITRPIITTLSGSISAITNGPEKVRDPATGTVVPLVRTDEIKTTLNYGTLEAIISAQPFTIPLGLGIGVSSSWPFLAKRFEQTEEITSPDGVLFPDNTRKHVVASGSLLNAQVLYQALASIRYSLPAGRRAEIVPELTFTYTINNILSDANWNAFTMRAGASLLFAFEKGHDVPPPVEPAPKERKLPEGSIASRNAARIDITETTVTETYPILPYIFYDKDSSDVPSRYRKASKKFNEDSLPNNSIEIYRNVLDVIGSRLGHAPDAKLTVVATTDGKEITDITAKRAKNIARYFTKTWGIDSSRITTRVHGMPDIPTTAEGAADENRRVEFTSSDPALFRPVVHAHFSEYSLTPPRIEFNLGARAEGSDVARWQLTLEKNSSPLAHFAAAGAPPEKLTWDIPQQAARALGDGDNLHCVLTVYNSEGDSSHSDFLLPVTKKRDTVEVGRLSLIVFDFDRADISSENKGLIRSFVAESITPRSVVRITGSTDSLGESRHNEELSLARAIAVRDVLLGVKPDAKIVEVKGLGESQLLYDNTLPEGRYYCRTVQVEVRTPVQ